MSSVLEIDLEKISCNTSRVVAKCHQQGIQVLGVTKGFSAMQQIVTAMLEGGVAGLADSRMENIIELRNQDFDQQITLLRIPRLSNVANVIRYTDMSINSEIRVIEALSQEAMRKGSMHEIILMVDVGDHREGIMKDNVISAAKQISDLKGVKLVGLGTNMGCFGGVLPSQDNLGLLVTLASNIENQIGIKLEIVSGGGTSSLWLVENHTVPDGVNQLRVGEGILLGTDTTHNRKIPWLYDDAFLLSAEVIEVKSKPSVPTGEIGRDSFGNIPKFTDNGIRKRAILALGKQEVYVEGLIPVDRKMVILGASSDHMIVDITDSKQEIRVGDEITFFLTYAGLLAVSDSKYVKKIFRRKKDD